MSKMHLIHAFTAIASLSISESAFSYESNTPKSSAQQEQAQTYISGEIVKEGQLPSGYNASASFQCENNWDIFLTADYTYWNWQKNFLNLEFFTLQME